MNISEIGNFTDELKTLEIDIPNKKFLINGHPFGCKCREISIWGNGRKWSVQIEKTITYKGEMEAAPTDTEAASCIFVSLLKEEVDET